MIPRPPKGIPWALAQTATYDILIAGFASIVGFTSTANFAGQGKPRLALLVGVATVGVLLLSLVKQGIGLAAARKKESTHELEGCLYLLHSVLDPSAAETPGRVRLAVHVPVDESLEQVTEYIGDRPKRGRIGRRFPANSGIIGMAYRENDVFIGRRVNDDYELYVRELITDWNYTEERARHLNPGVMEWIAVPFYNHDQGKVEAVLYADANERGFFTPERQELILAAVNGIAIFIGRRYA